MMDWTDRHCRMFHRRFSRRAVLYTEMVTAAAVVHGDAARLLAHDPAEHPLVLQLGGSDPAELASAVRRAVPFGFAAINLNVGCPSDRVQSGRFGACLMREPDLVAACVAAMQDAGGPPVTVKCRIGVDDQDPAAALPRFVDTLAAAGVRVFIVHARKAWLQGLSPKQNREVPPLDYDVVRDLARARPDLAIVLNGGIGGLDQAMALAPDFAGVMVGRAAYHDPVAVLGGADDWIAGGAPGPEPDRIAAVAGYLPYVAAELARGTRLGAITRHMLGAFAGRPGARTWRRRLTEGPAAPGAGIEVIEQALDVLGRAAEAA